MKDLYLKRNELNEKSQKLRVVKFHGDLPREKITKLMKEQDEIYKRWKFYDNYIKIGGRIYGKQIHSKEV